MKIDVNCRESELLQRGLNLLEKKLSERGFSDETVAEYNAIKELTEKIYVNPITERTQKIYVKIKDDAFIEKLKELLSCHGGNNPVYIYNATTKKLKAVERKYWVNVDQYLIEDLQDMPYTF